jgi:adenylate cyclase
MDLNNCKLTFLPQDLFENLVSLELLNLTDNTVSVLPPLLKISENKSASGCLKLKRLMLNNMKLDVFPENMEYLNELEHLSLFGNNLKKIPSSIWQLKRLIVLNLSSNFLINLPSPDADVLASKAESIKLLDNLRELYLGENRCNNEIADSLKYLTNLEVLNISYNNILDLGDCLRHLTSLRELYLSGNQFSSFPEEIEGLKKLQFLYFNCNKLSNIPPELAALTELSVFDVSNNNLKYNVANWPYDWNWNWNLALRFLSLSNNKKLEIKPMGLKELKSGSFDLSTFTALKHLRLLDVSEIKQISSVVPEEGFDRRIRQSRQESGTLGYGIAEHLGRRETFNIWDFVQCKYLGSEKDYFCGFFDGKDQGGAIAKFLYESCSLVFNSEMRKLKPDEDINDALRRTFLNLNRDIGAFSLNAGTLNIDHSHGSCGLVAYLHEGKLYIANVGDSIAVLCRGGIALCAATKHHIWNRSELKRIRSTGGFATADARILGYIH